jgi:hypothetical protein
LSIKSQCGGAFCLQIDQKSWSRREKWKQSSADRLPLSLSLSRQAHANPKRYQNVNLEYLVFFTSVKRLITIHLKLPKGLKAARETIMKLFLKLIIKLIWFYQSICFCQWKRVNYYSCKTTQEVKKTQEKQMMKFYYKIIIKIFKKTRASVL